MGAQCYNGGVTRVVTGALCFLSAVELAQPYSVVGKAPFMNGIHVPAARVTTTAVHEGRFVMSDTPAKWRKRVYHQSQARWLPFELRLQVIERDALCQCCEGLGQSVHHIIPHSEGGPDTLDNLILLCDKCHDEVEAAGYRNREDIAAHEPQWLARIRKRREHKVKRVPTAPEDDWHLWVYGGFRNPNI